MKNANKDELDEFEKIYSTLEEDINSIYKQDKKDDDQKTKFNDPSLLKSKERRDLTRSIFAFVEGTCFCLRSTLLRNFSEKLSAPEIMALKEQQIEIDGNGKIQTKPAKTSLIKLIKLTVAISSKIFEESKVLECKGNKFESLARAIKVRDRLMHPRSSEHLIVTNQEISDAINGYIWFKSVILVTLARSIRMIESDTRKLKNYYEKQTKQNKPK